MSNINIVNVACAYNAPFDDRSHQTHMALINVILTWQLLFAIILLAMQINVYQRNHLDSKAVGNSYMPIKSINLALIYQNYLVYIMPYNK